MARPPLATSRVWQVAAGLFVLALVVRLLCLQQLRAWPLYDQLDLILDARYYDLRARDVAAGSWVFEVPHFLSPLYCYVLGIVYRVFGEGLETARLFQCVLGAGSCALLFGIGRRLFSDGVGILAALFLCFFDLVLFYHALVLPTTLVLFTNLCCAFVLAKRGSEQPRPARCLLAGVWLGLAAAAKPNALLLLPALAVVIWFWRRRAQEPASTARILALAAGAVLAVAPFTLHNQVVGDAPVLISTTGGRNLYKGNGPFATGTHVFLPPDKQGIRLPRYLHGKVAPHEPIEESRRLTAETWAHVRETPGRALGLLGRKLLLAFNARELGVRDNLSFVSRYSSLLRFTPIAFGLIAPLGLVGLFFARRQRGAWLLQAFLAVQLVTLVLLFVLARYRIVAAACLCLLAAWQLRWWWQRRRAPGGRQLSIALLLLGAAVVHFPLLAHPREAGFGIQYEALGEHHLAQDELPQALIAFERAAEGDWLDMPDRELRRLKCRTRAGSCQAALGLTEQARTTFARLLRDLELRQGDAVRELREIARARLGEIEAAGGTREP